MRRRYRIETNRVRRRARYTVRRRQVDSSEAEEALLLEVVQGWVDHTLSNLRDDLQYPLWDGKKTLGLLDPSAPEVDDRAVLDRAVVIIEPVLSSLARL